MSLPRPRPRPFLLLLFAVAVLTSTFAACSPSDPAEEAAPPDTADQTAPASYDLPADFEAAEGSISAEQLRSDVAALADDTMEGRGPGSDGDRKAREYIAERMAEIGLEPGVDGGWEQPFDIVGVTATVPDQWTFAAAEGELTLERHEQFIAASGVQSPTSTIDGAEVVFVGYGIQAPEYEWDDYGDADLEGKVLLMLNNDPDWDDELFAGDTRLYYGRWTYKYESAAAQGAAGAIIIHTTPSAGYGWNVVQTSWTGQQFDLPAEDEPRTPVEAWVTEEAAKSLLELAGQDYDALLEQARSPEFEPVPLGVTTSLQLTNVVNRTQTANVVGRLPGTDPELADEAVVWTAHHDHLGISDDESAEDRIYNGALDNAAGVAQVLAIAEALTKTPTARSHLFVMVGAEEQGLLGSAYYASHPTIPPGKMVANINYDGGNIWGRTTDVTYIGYGKSTLDEIVEAAAARQGRSVKPDQFPDRGFFYRSDQFNFAKIGVPAIYLDTGTEFRDRAEGWGKEQIEAWEARDYHQVSDELNDDWNFEGMVEDAQMGLYAGVVIGNAETIPEWNPGDEFEAARKAALAAVEGR